MSRFIPEHPKKGSAEAYVWAEKMRLAREKKKRTADRIRKAGLEAEEKFFGPGGPLAPKALKKHTLNPGKSYSIVCQANGCTFHREHLSKKQANKEAVSHMNMYGHSVAIVEKNPGAAWHKGMAAVAGRYRKDAVSDVEKHIYAGMEQAHKDSASAAGKLGMNPRRKKRDRKGMLVDQVTLYGGKLAEIYQTDYDTFSVYVGGKIQGSYHSLDEAKGLVRFYVHSLSHDNPKKRTRKNPIAIYNPPNVAGTIYNNAIEIKAQKTGGPLKGHYKHIFDSKKVRILGLTDGTVLLQHIDNKPLWITRKDYERSGRKH